jgi:hypothetical protein
VILSFVTLCDVVLFAFVCFLSIEQQDVSYVSRRVFR